MASKSLAGEALLDLIKDIGVPQQLVADGAQEQVGRKTLFAKTVRKYNIDFRQTEPYTPRQNHAGRIIGELRRRWRYLVNSRTISPRLWDYGCVYLSEILSRTAKGTHTRTGMEILTGETPDISEWADFSFYDPVWFWAFPLSTDEEEKAKLGRWLGVSHRIGSNMCYFVLTDKANVVSRTSVQHVTSHELSTPDLQERLTNFDTRVKDIMNDDNHIVNRHEKNVFYVEDILPPDEPQSLEERFEVDDYTVDAYDEYLSA
jgi:hypothetical protein